jgi:HK97 family phage major capsid protein
MSTLDDLRVEHDALLEQIRILADEDDLSDFADARFRELCGRARVVADRIGALERRTALTNRVANNANIREVPGVPSNTRTNDAVGSALRSIDRLGNALPPRQQDMMDRLVRSDPDYAAEFAALSDPSYESAWWKLVEMGEQRALYAMDDHERAAMSRAMNETVGTSGGYGVPTMVDPSVVLEAGGSANPFRRVARVTPVTTNKITGVTSEGVAAGWGAELSTVDDDSPTLGQPVWSVEKAHAWIPFSVEVGDDYPDFRNEMARLLAEAKDELESETFATGAGTGNVPLGIITALDANTNVELGCVTAGTLTGVDVSAAWLALPDRFKGNARWMMSYSVGEHIALLADTSSGTNLSTQTITLTDAGISRLRGKEVLYSGHFPSFSDTDAAWNHLIIGDFSHYRIFDRVGLQVELVPVVLDATTARPIGARGFYAYWRCAAGPDTDLAFRLLQSTTGT